MTCRSLLKIIGVLFLLIMMGLFYLSTGFLGGKIYVQCILALAILFNLIILQGVYFNKTSAKKRSEAEDSPKISEETHEGTILLSPQIGALLLLPIASALLWEKLTFVGSSMICTYLLLRLCKNSRLKSLIVSVSVVLIVQAVFVNVFMVSLPTPAWWPR